MCDRCVHCNIHRTFCGCVHCSAKSLNNIETSCRCKHTSCVCCQGILKLMHQRFDSEYHLFSHFLIVLLCGATVVICF